MKTKNIFPFFIILLFITTIANGQLTKLTVDDVFTNRSFAPKSIMGLQWFDNGNSYSFLKMNPETKSMDLYRHDLKSGEEKVIVSGSELKLKEGDAPFVIRNYEWSPNGRFILFTGMLPARSLKSGGTFYLFDFTEKKFFLLAESEQEQINAQFSPDGNKLGFVRGDNLFTVDIFTKEEKQLTFDGNENILNGHFDWVYEEEFGIIKGFEWSPDSKTIAYWRLDQTEVPQIQIQKWDSLYLNSIDMRYPKAGAKNSDVKIGIVSVETGKNVFADLGSETDIYIPRIKFTSNPNMLSIQRLNRLQNKLDFLFADVATGKTTTVFTETDPCWIEINDNLKFLKDGKHLIWQSERDGFNHFYLKDYNGKVINQITKGKWETDNIHFVDEQNKLIYYSSNERGTIYSDLYVIKFDGSGKKRLTENAGTHAINFSSGGEYFIDRYSNASLIPSSFLFDKKGEKVRGLAVSTMDGFKDYDLGTSEFVSFTTTDGVTLNGMLIKPSDFDQTKKYPVLIYNYSGPGSQTVKDSWQGANLLWHMMLAQKGYLVFMLDNRGTGGRGKEFKNIVYKNLGHWEVNDHIEGAKYLAPLPFVDAERIGIWGWSYGGYISALTLMKGAEYFKTAISVAPVTHWKFYDSIYTERFMSLPSLNPEGYETSAVLTYTDKLKGKLLLVHGTADDNVHFQNAVALVNKLIAENIQFETMYYPEKDHGIYGGKTRLHLYNMMTNFLLNNL
jgi:dipeptidyl-peptidase-4